jgi:hypothetical protein
MKCPFKVTQTTTQVTEIDGEAKITTTRSYGDCDEMNCMAYLPCTKKCILILDDQAKEKLREVN